MTAPCEPIVPSQTCRNRSPAVNAGLLLAVAAIAVVILLWPREAEKHALRDLPQTERKALFERTLRNLTSVCPGASEALLDFCDKQAHLLLDLPECDGVCRAAARQQLERTEATR